MCPFLSNIRAINIIQVFSVSQKDRRTLFRTGSTSEISELWTLFEFYRVQCRIGKTQIASPSSQQQQYTRGGNGMYIDECHP